MNIVEAYIKFNDQLIIIVSGLSGSGKNKLAKNISKDFKLLLINIDYYCNKKYDEKIKLPDGTEVINYNSYEIYDWDKINNEMDKNKSKGIIVVGDVFPHNKINKENKIDYHIHIKLSKENLIKKRLEYIKENNETCAKIGRNIDPKNEEFIFNEYTFPYYKNELNNEIITKYINANNYINDTPDIYDEKIYNEAFNYLINQIQKFMDEHPLSTKN